MKSLLIIVSSLFLMSTDVLAQDWASTGGPSGGFNQIIFNAKKDMFLSAGTLMRSTDKGKSWSKIAPLDAPEGVDWTVSIAPNQDIYITGGSTDSVRLWKSEDNGDTWKDILLKDVYSLLISPNGNIYCIHINKDTTYSLFRSQNGAKTWDTLPISIPKGNFIFSDYNYNRPNEYFDHTNIVDSNGVLIFYVNKQGITGFAISSDQGNSWKLVLFETNGSAQSMVCGKHGNIFIATGIEAYRSSDVGQTWNEIPAILGNGSNGYFAVNPHGKLLSSGTYNYNGNHYSKLYYSEDNGDTWKNFVPNGIQIESSFAICGDADSGFYFMFNGETYHATNPNNWERPPFPTGSPSTLVVHPNGNVISLNENNLWHSNDIGANWQMDTTLQETSGRLVIDSSKNVFLVGLKNFRYNDVSKTWDFVSVLNSHASVVYDAIVIPSGIFFAATGVGTLMSPDNGLHWNSFHSVQINSLAINRKGILYEGVGGTLLEIFRSEDTNKTKAQFSMIENTPGAVQSLITDFYENVFAACYTSSFNMYRSIDQGKTWTEFGRGLSCTKMNSMIELPNGSIAAATDSGVFILPLLGCEWIPYSSGLWRKNVPNIACSKSGQLYAGSDGCGVFKSTKLFNDIVKLTGIIDPGSLNYDTVTIGSATCLDVTLKNRGLKPFTIHSLTITDPVPFSVSDESVKKLPAILNPKDSIKMTICFHPTQPARYTSSIIWNTDLDVSLCGIPRESILEGLAIQKAFVSSESQESKFSIHPNPIAEKAEIHFSLSRPDHVKLECFDMLGVRLKILADGNYEPGDNSLVWDTSDLPAGIYTVECTFGTAHSSHSVIVLH